MKIMHFNSQRERLAFLKGDYNEIIPKKAVKKTKKDAVDEKKSPKKASKPKKSKKKEKKDEVQAE